MAGETISRRLSRRVVWWGWRNWCIGVQHWEPPISSVIKASYYFGPIEVRVMQSSPA